MAIHPTKFIFVTGGVVSSLGKGIAASAIGMLLEKKGLKIALMKLDPYLNVDPGTMSPYQHGEVYVTNDGAETDLDLGHYFRFTDSPLSKKSSISSGQIYNDVIARERRGDYLGKTVQVVPHITDEIKLRIHECSRQEEQIDVVLCEIGGTVGDIESLPFLEAIRQMRYELPDSCLNIHATYVPFIKAAGEVKTKPTQHSVQQLREIGISPDIIICRSESPLSTEVKEKISLFCNVRKEAVIEATDVQHSIYEVPLQLHDQGLEEMIVKMLQLKTTTLNLCQWQSLIDAIQNPSGHIRIGIVGKYVQHQDAYKSVFESLQHAAIACGHSLSIERIESEKLNDLKVFPEEARGFDGYLIPGGFGDRGWEGKILAATYCRENNIPYFGICLGMQVLAVEFARNVLNLKDADSTEMNPKCAHPVISLIDEQRQVTNLGGTMRLGSYPCTLQPNTLAYNAYQNTKVYERHRHRYELNNFYRKSLIEAGITISGLYEECDLCEIMEVKNHPWMMGVQFHPEFESKPTKPHPLFQSFIQAAITHKKALTCAC